MLFSSVQFLFFFLPAVLLCYYAVPAKAKNYVLLVFSLFFYFCGEPIYTVLMIFSSLSDYTHSLIIEKNRGKKTAKVALISSIVINLALLGFFKYADFFISNINLLLGLEIPLLNVPLPIGISFYTFQTMSYTIDVYRGEAKAEKNLASLATYVCLFPQLVAGPIVRYTTVADELSNRTHSIERTSKGIARFAVGLGKKILIANQMGALCAAFRASDDKSVLFYWLYAIAFTLQIYFDFSGYSDMAIGLGHMFGFTFSENFNYPYVSKSVTEFWRRWHMTLGSFFRDYVYIPLGGNRCSMLKWLRNIFVVWMLTGFWHGAAWNFIVWGLLFGVLLIVEKLWLNKALEKLPSFVSHVYVMLVVIISFVIFNGASLAEAGTDIAGMFGGLDVPLVSVEAVYALRSNALLLIVAAIGSTPIVKKAYTKLSELGHGTVSAIAQPILVVCALLICTGYLVDGSFNPFLYFRF